MTVRAEPDCGSNPASRLGGQRERAAIPSDGEAPPAFANPARGEASLRVAGERLVLRPSFSALVAAEAELGPLFGLVERAAEGRLALAEMVGLFWHCLHEAPAGLTREALGEGVVASGLAGATPVLKVLLQQILAGR